MGGAGGEGGEDVEGRVVCEVCHAGSLACAGIAYVECSR